MYFFQPSMNVPSKIMIYASSKKRDTLLMVILDLRTYFLDILTDFSFFEDHSEISSVMGDINDS